MSILDILGKVTNFLVKNEANIQRGFSYLVKFGYITPGQEQTIESVIKAIKMLQMMGGLPVTGELDGKTLNLMAQNRCGNLDVENLTENAGQPNKWGLSELTWYVSGYDTEVSKTEWIDSIDAAFYSWSEVCALKFKQVGRPEEANIILGIGQGRADDFDGSSGTLAWMQLCPSYNYKGRVSGKFDRDELWIPKGKTGRGIYLENVACHEIGHALAFNHSTNPSDLLAAFYSQNVSKPQSGDKKRAQALYGPATSIPSPTPNPPTGEEKEIVIRLSGANARVSIDGYRLSKIG